MSTQPDYLEVRLIGTPEQVEDARRQLRELYVIVRQRSYPSRRNPAEVRLYLDVIPRPDLRDALARLRLSLQGGGASGAHS